MNRKKDLKQGIICGLTDRIAEFSLSCDKFEKDQTEVEKIYTKKISEDKRWA